MQLLACPSCHAQYDVTHIRLPSFPCRCGARIENCPHEPVHAEIKRCAGCGGSVDEGTVACGYCGSTIERDDRHRSMVCPECHARNVGAAKFCSACGIEFRPIAIDGERVPLPCPECEGLDMLPTQIGGVDVDECGHCNGLWVAGAHFDALVERARERAESRYSIGLDGGDERAPMPISAARSKIRYRRCPQCGDFMQRRNFGARSGVIVDWCADHGTWLDADELELISTFVLSGGLQTPAATASTADVDGIAELIRSNLGEAGGRGFGGIPTVLTRGRRPGVGRGLWSDLLRNLLDW